MANVKNFGLIGVGSDLQFGKGGAKVKQSAGAFALRNAADSADAALTLSALTASTGNVTLSSAGGKVVINGTDILQKSAGGQAQIAGSAGLVLPSGGTETRVAELGAIRVNNSVVNAATVEFYDGDEWITLASGGNTAVLQTEIDNIETALGAAINTDGTFNAAGFTGAAAGATSFTDAIQQVADAAAAKDTLEEIEPVAAIGNIIYADSGSTWAQALPGATSGVQAYDAGLAAFAAKTSTGILVQTGADTYASVSLTAPAAGITITNADGVAGSPTFALANDLAGLEGLTGTGFAVRTGDGTWTEREITGTAGRIEVTNGDGVASAPTIDLATVTQADTGTFSKVTLDSYGRVTGNTAVTTADITALVGSTYVDVAGDTMTGNLNMGGTFTVTGLASPVGGTDATNKSYVDNLVSGLSWKQAVAVLSDADVDVATGGLVTIDGYTVVAGDRVLLTAQTDDTQDGIYIAAAGAWVRATDADVFGELNGAAVFVQRGTVYANTGWTQNTELSSFAGQNWAQFSGAGAYSAGTGLNLSGTTFSVNLGAGIAELPTDEIGIDLFDPTAGALALTSDGTTRGTATGNKLTLILDAAGGLAQTSAGLKINAASVTNAMLVNDSLTTDADTGTGDLALGGTLNIIGTSTQGISTSVSGGTFTITAADASASQKGVATFNTADFAVTAGDVTIKAGGVDNAQLVNSAISLAGDTGTGTVSLGGTLNVTGDSTFITVAATGSTFDITLGTVDVAHGGTGLTTVTANQVLFGGAANTITQDADFAFDATTNTLTLGSGTIAGTAGGDLTITATGTNADINLVPNGTGSVVIGSTGAGVIESEAGQSMTVTGNNTLVLQSTAGDIVMTLAAGTTDKVTVSGPTATQYATGLANEDLTNKQYVDTAIATAVSGSDAGEVKSVMATVSLASTGSFNIGTALPAGATVLSVKVNVTAVDTATGTLVVGKAGGSEYMTDVENETQVTGLYIAETMVTEASSTQVQATVGGVPGGSGSATIVVTYRLA